MSTLGRISRVALVLLLLVSGCSRNAAQSDAPFASEDPTPSLVLRGHLVWGHEVRSFTECGSSETGWIVDKTEDDLQQMVQSVTTEPYESVLVEVQAEIAPPLTEGFGADYDYSLVVTKAKLASDGQPCE